MKSEVPAPMSITIGRFSKGPVTPVCSRKLLEPLLLRLEEQGSFPPGLWLLRNLSRRKNQPP